MGALLVTLSKLCRYTARSDGPTIRVRGPNFSIHQYILIIFQLSRLLVERQGVALQAFEAYAGGCTWRAAWAR